MVIVIVVVVVVTIAVVSAVILLDLIGGNKDLAGGALWLLWLYTLLLLVLCPLFELNMHCLLRNGKGLT